MPDTLLEKFFAATLRASILSSEGLTFCASARQRFTSLMRSQATEVASARPRTNARARRPCTSANVHQAAAAAAPRRGFRRAARGAERHWATFSCLVRPLAAPTVLLALLPPR